MAGPLPSLSPPLTFALALHQAEVIVKPVADRSKGFSELQTFDPQQVGTRRP